MIMEAMETITTGVQQLETTILQLRLEAILQLRLEAHHQTDTIRMIEDLHHHHHLALGLEDLAIHMWTTPGQQIII